MIPAAKRRLFNAWFSWDAERRLRAHFAVGVVTGLEHFRAAVAEAPVLVVSNHSAWWDPLWAIVLTSRVVHSDGYALMNAANLLRLPFFARVGAFGVDLEDPADGARAIRYASRLLDRPGRVVFVFPQGAERPSTWRPLAFRGGAAAIARVARKARVVPMALRYEQAGEQRPRFLCAFGPPLAWTRDLEAARTAQEAAVTQLLDGIDAALDARVAPMWRQRSGALERLAERALAWLTRGAVTQGSEASRHLGPGSQDDDAQAPGGAGTPSPPGSADSGTIRPSGKNERRRPRHST